MVRVHRSTRTLPDEQVSSESQRKCLPELPCQKGSSGLQALQALSASSGIPTCGSACFILSYKSVTLLSFFFFIWLSLHYSNWVISIILSSRSLILSSALSILLFIAVSSPFVYGNDFSNFSWLLLIASSRFLQ